MATATTTANTATTAEAPNGVPSGATSLWKVFGGDETWAEAKARYAKAIKQEDLDHWHKHGYVVIERFLDQEELAAIHADFQDYMPTWDEYKQHKRRYQGYEGQTWRRRGQGNFGIIRDEFPYDGDAVNMMATHPFLVAFCERLVGHDDLFLSHGAIVGKYAGKGDYDQPLHADYSGNTMVIPAHNKEWIDIPMLLYYSDVTVDLGPTYVVSQEVTEPLNLVADGFRFHTREQFPELYKVEQPNVVPAGSVLIYSMRTFHRGSRMLAKEGARFTQFTAFHVKGVPWLGSATFQGNAGSAEMDRYLTHASPEQRVLVGFPPVGSPYWKEKDALEGVANRYPKMDLRPYGGGPPKIAPEEEFTGTEDINGAPAIKKAGEKDEKAVSN
ncbi:hypothetical protein CALVIDRAFT_596879 [Calocera viscosa TUFC12733]|uniref:PhyH-domain-containing protein n=1 Tax=Calocera viscosa (strain TUFC12733) TaxID=1330018 RepID=A0A167P2E8_CALVF|nr:hypothetical protein CALVIDRAFT_596879 [Calocera viscosa TUFC12733]